MKIERNLYTIEDVKSSLIESNKAHLYLIKEFREERKRDIDEDIQRLINDFVKTELALAVLNIFEKMAINGNALLKAAVGSIYDELENLLSEEADSNA